MPGAPAKESDLKPGHFSLSVGYRNVSANQYFLNSKVFTRENQLQKPSRTWNTLDVTGTYQATKRVNLALTLPVVLNKMSFLEPGDGGPLELQQRLYGSSIGDILLVGRSWVLDPERKIKGNVMLGTGLKFPTGNFRQQGTYADSTGTIRTRKAIPLTIMPGDGGLGILFEGLAYRQVNFPLRSSTLFAYGNYMVTPRNTTNTPSQVQTTLNPIFLVNPASQTAFLNTVPDTFSVRTGYLFGVPKAKSRWLKGLNFQIGYRFEGSPVRDLFGRSDGFRQPGYFMAVEPGIFYKYKRHLVSCTVPISFLRVAQADIAQKNGSPDDRTTAFSPASVNLRYTYAY